MLLFYNLKIASKLLLAFAAVAAAMGWLAWVGLPANAHLDAAARDSTDSGFEKY